MRMRIEKTIHILKRFFMIYSKCFCPFCGSELISAIYLPLDFPNFAAEAKPANHANNLVVTLETISPAPTKWSSLGTDQTEKSLVNISKTLQWEDVDDEDIRYCEERFFE